MNEKQRAFVEDYLYRRLLILIPDSIEAGEITKALLDEVIEDISETADPENWHSGDIDIALARVLKKKLIAINHNNNTAGRTSPRCNKTTRAMIIQR